MASCARVTSINMKEHRFGVQPTKIIWIQIAGLDDQMLSLVKFNSERNDSSFENFTCFGRSWDYNLFKLRPSSYSSFLTEITGKKNIKGTCEDYKSKPLWHYLKESSYTTAILENPINIKNSLTQAKACNEEQFLKDSTLFSMSSSGKDEKLFHYAESLEDLDEGVYYDRSCKKGQCYSLISENAVSIYEKYLKINNSNHLLLVRDFSFEKAVLSGKVKLIQKKIEEFDKLINYFFELQKNDKSLLVIVSSASAIGVDLPVTGQNWENIENLKYKQRMLNSPILVSGARAENFCGIYEKAQLLPRLLTRPKDLGLEYSFFNPFR